MVVNFWKLPGSNYVGPGNLISPILPEKPTTVGFSGSPHQVLHCYNFLVFSSIQL